MNIRAEAPGEKSRKQGTGKVGRLTEGCSDIAG